MSGVYDEPVDPLGVPEPGPAQQYLVRTNGNCFVAAFHEVALQAVYSGHTFSYNIFRCENFE